jgi:O-antigen ligase
MLFLFIYLVFLFIAPQLWIEPFVGMRVDLFLYPAWIGWIAMTGRAAELFRLGPQDWFFAAWLVWIVVSIAVNGFADNSSSIIQDYVKWFVLFRLTVVSLPTLTHVRRGLLLLLFFGLILAIEGIQQMHNPSGAGWAGQGFSWVDIEAARAGVAGRTRWINIFDGPGVFCVVYTIALPFAAQYLGKPFGARSRVLGLLLLAPLLLATFYTGSRGGFLATVGVFGLFLMTKLRISLGRVVLIGGVLLAVLALAPGYLTSTSDAERSAQHRIDMWAEGIEMVRYNPVFGIGRGNFLRYTNRLIAHNSAIEIMGETGFPGLFLWLGIIYMGFKNLSAAYRETEDAVLRSYVIALGLSVAGYLMSSMFVTLEYETFYLLLAFMAAVGHTLSAPPKFTRSDLWKIGAIMAVFFVGVKSLVMLYV